MSNFFDKAKKDMGKYLKAAGVKAEEIAENTKINLEIYSLNREKDEILLSIGKMVYKMYRRGQFDSSRIEKECTAVAEIDEEIKRVKENKHNMNREAKNAYRRTQKGKYKSHREREKKAEREDNNSEAADEQNLGNDGETENQGDSQ